MKKTKKVFHNTWLFDNFCEDESYFEKKMFGGLAAYVNGRMVMVLTESPGEKSYRGKEYGFDIWDGVLLPTEREHHDSLMSEFKELRQHPVLGKWLYLPAKNNQFENVGSEIGGKIAEGDPRFGIDPAIKKK